MYMTYKLSCIYTDVLWESRNKEKRQILPENMTSSSKFVEYFYCLQCFGIFFGETGSYLLNIVFM